MAIDKIDVTKGITGTLPVANGGTGLTSGFVNGGLVYVGGLSTTTEAATYAVDNVFTSTYNNYLIIIEKLAMKTTGAGVDFNWRTGGSSGSTDTSAKYSGVFAGFRSDTGAATSRTASNDTKMRLTHGLINDAETNGLTGFFFVNDPYEDQRVRMNGNYSYCSDVAGETRTMQGGVEFRNEIVCTGFIVTGYGGSADDDFVAADIKVYGVVNS